MSGALPRWLRWGLIGTTVLLGLGIVTALGVFLALHRPLPDGTPGPEADARARAMIASVGGMEAWEDLEAVAWTFGGRRSHVWDKARGRHRFEVGDRVVVYDLATKQGVATDAGQPLAGAALRDAINDAWAAFCNDSFWLNAVVKAFDDGTTREAVTLDDGREAVLVTYASGGVTPGDSYLWILGDDGRPEAWRMWVSILPVGGLETTWEAYETLPGGAQVATRHHWSLVGITLEIGDLRGGPLADVAPDAFDALGAPAAAPEAPAADPEAPAVAPEAPAAASEAPAVAPAAASEAP